MGGKALAGRRISRDEVGKIVCELMDEIGPWVKKYEVCGSYRRGHPDCGDVDLVVQTDDEPSLNEALKELFGQLKTDPNRPKKSGLIDGVQVEVKVAKPEEWGAAILTATGSGTFNIRMRALAKGLGFLLNEKGLYVRDGLKRVAGTTEKEVFEELGMAYKTPSQRD